MSQIQIRVELPSVRMQQFGNRRESEIRTYSDLSSLVSSRTAECSDCAGVTDFAFECKDSMYASVIRTMSSDFREPVRQLSL